jgi:hypothetical protein
MATYSFKSNYSKDDDYMTPKYAWEWIKDFIPKDKVIWEPFYGDGKSGEYLSELGFNVIHTQEDFFQVNYGDLIVTNPPFSNVKKIIERLLILDKPFILLMPFNRLFTKYFQELLKDKIQIIIPKKRIQYIKNGKSDGRCCFESVYYCFNLNLIKDITFLPTS